MLSAFDQRQLVLALLVAVAAGGLVLALALPWLMPAGLDARVKEVTSRSASPSARRQSAVSRLVEGPRATRRQKVQETLKQIEERSTPRKRGVSLHTQLGRSGLAVTVRAFWAISAAVGIVLALVPVLLGMPLFIGALSGLIGFLGVPRWSLSWLAKRRQAAFLDGLADAIEVVIRSLKAGLPISDALRVIATEFGPPLGPEFLEVVEGQRLGITIDQGLERLFERMPLAEVSFLGIVINIQSKTGGNLAEALANLSRLLRERKRMKAKIRAMAQEAKSSAAIIGALPFCIIAGLFLLSPGYLLPLMSTDKGHLILACCGAWMLGGMLIMRKMISFEV